MLAEVMVENDNLHAKGGLLFFLPVGYNNKSIEIKLEPHVYGVRIVNGYCKKQSQSSREVFTVCICQ